MKIFLMTVRQCALRARPGRYRADAFLDLTSAKKYKIYKSSINKSLHTVQKSLHSSPRGHCEVVIKALRSSPTYKEFEIDAMSKKCRKVRIRLNAVAF